MKEILLELLGDHQVAGFQELQAHDKGVDLGGVDPHAVAAKALRLQ